MWERKITHWLSKCCLWSRTGFDNEMRRKGKAYQWLTMSSVFESGAAQKYRCSLLQTLREAGPASHPVLRRLRPGKLEEKGSQWVCNCEQAEQGLACMLFVQDMYSLVWGSTASVVGYGFLDCCVCNYKCIICAWEKHLDTYGNNPEGLQVQSDYCVHASHGHHPTAIEVYLSPQNIPSCFSFFGSFLCIQKIHSK